MMIMIMIMIMITIMIMMMIMMMMMINSVHYPRCTTLLQLSSPINSYWA
jgi:hypothetical protein